MLYSIRVEQKLNPLAAGGSGSEQRHFDSVSVVSSDSLQTCQPTTDTDSRCFFNATCNTNSSNKIRAEPLAWPCSFALPGLTARGTLQAYAGWRTWGYNTLSTLYPQVSNTTEYRSTSGLAPLNNCETTSKTASWCGDESQGRAHRGNLATLHRQKMRGGRKPQLAPSNSNTPSNSYLAWGLGGDCVLASPSNR
jgi:hypothetical protein